MHIRCPDMHPFQSLHPLNESHLQQCNYLPVIVFVIDKSVTDSIFYLVEDGI